MGLRGDAHGHCNPPLLHAAKASTLCCCREWVLNTTPGKGDVWRVSTPRIHIYREIMRRGNWKLDGPMAISKRPAPAGGYSITNTYYGEFLLA